MSVRSITGVAAALALSLISISGANADDVRTIPAPGAAQPGLGYAQFPGGCIGGYQCGGYQSAITIPFQGNGQLHSMEFYVSAQPQGPYDRALVNIWANGRLLYQNLDVTGYNVFRRISLEGITARTIQIVPASWHTIQFSTITVRFYLYGPTPPPPPPPGDIYNWNEVVVKAREVEDLAKDAREQAEHAHSSDKQKKAVKKLKKLEEEADEFADLVQRYPNQPLQLRKDFDDVRNTFEDALDAVKDADLGDAKKRLEKLDDRLDWLKRLF